MNRPNTRTALREQRRSLSADVRDVAATELANHFVHTPWFKTNNRIACYLSNDGEIDPRLIIEKIWEANKECYLPVIKTTSEKHLQFVRYRDNSKLVPNKYGILEPLETESKVLSAKELDVVLVPLVAFDETGNRLGMGGGYYDHTSSFLKENPEITKPVLIGLGYEFQHLEHIPPHEKDILLDAIVTDKNIIRMIES